MTLNILCPGAELQVIFIALVFAVIGTIAVVYFKHRKVIIMWLYVRNYCSCVVSGEQFEMDKKYHAFVVYSHKDDDFVADFLIPELEGFEGFKLCIHERDLTAGLITKNVRSVHVVNFKIENP